MLSPNDIEGRMQQGMEKMGEESFKLKSISRKIKLNSLNNAKSKANKFLEGNSSGLFSSHFNTWKKENDIVTNYKTPKDEYKKYVEEFLEDLENQIDSV